MKKYLALIIAAAMVLSLSACGDEQAEISEPTEYGTEKIILNDVDENSFEAQAVKAAAAEMLDVFISADFDAIKEILVDEDEEYFDFENEEQKEFYLAILPKIEYEFSFVKEHDGVYGVMTTIFSPDMAAVYGSMIIDLMDSEEGMSSDEFRAKNTETMKRMLNANDGSVPTRVEELYIYVECNNGVYTPRCDMYLANELLGGAAEASDEIGSTVLDAINTLGSE